MSKGFNPGYLIIIGLICVIGGAMWDASVGTAWQDLNNSTDAGTVEHTATSTGQIFGYGFGMFLIIIGVLAMVGALILGFMGAFKSFGR